MPFLLLLASFFLNYKFNSNSEIAILKQYLGIKDIYSLLIFLMGGLFLFYFLNSEYFSVNMYHKYKISELEIRNNLKLGTPSENEFNIENEVSLFFDKKKDGIFFNIEALIYKQGQFIKSKRAKIEFSKRTFNLVFYEGERLILNSIEKSKTTFDRFTYIIENKEIEELLMDKEHFDTKELIKHSDKEFNNHGHNRIYQYFLTLVVILISFKIILSYEPKKNLFDKFSIIFIILLLLQIINSYSLYLLNNYESYKLLYYYISNFILLILYNIFCNKYIK